MLVRCPSCESSYRLDPARVPQHAVRVRCPRCTTVFRVAPPEAAAPAPAPPAGVNDLGIEREAWHQPPRSPTAAPLHPAPPASGNRPFAPGAPKLPAWTSESERTLDFGAAAPKPPAPRLETTPFRPGAAPMVPVMPPASAMPAPVPEPRPVFESRVMPAPGHRVPGPSPFPPPGPARSRAVETMPPVAVAPPAPVPAAGGPAHTRARRLARVLVSDVLVYNQAARDRALQEGSLASVLAPEITKAWDLYKTKVGPEVATTTPYFKDALNEILAGGATVF